MGITDQKLKKMLDALTRVEARQGASSSALKDDPIEWGSRALGVDLDDWQAEIMQADVNRLAVIASRQSGKSTVTAARAGYEAAANPGHRIVVIAPTFRQSSMLRSKVLDALLRARVEHEQNREMIRLMNGSIIRALPGDDPDKVRGATADLVIIDECAFVKPNVTAAVLPMLASTAGDLIAVSTPNGPTGLFHELATSGNATVIEVPASRIARFDPEVIADLRARLGGARASQELDCQFVLSSGSVFDASALAAMFGDAPDDLDLGELERETTEKAETAAAAWERHKREQENRERREKGWTGR